ncbi:homoserine kinase [Neptuniibacter halophilus]|uniref:homoserine kinase n=1 Tax=Neptuniibacter halophilus TaxID=651666 RepID=UPI002572C7BF|nr:homoserine kinase [Neptuniibacter halophilus]
MSVYTSVSFTELEQHLTEYEVGQLIAYEGISAGVENSNFFVDTDQGRYVLTLVESVSSAELPFILGLVQQLSRHGLPCAELVPLRNGDAFSSLNQRPAVLMRRLNGAPLEQPNLAQTGIIGATLARAHQLAAELPARRSDQIPLWCQQLAERLMPRLKPEQQSLLEKALAEAHQLDWENLPAGPVHADLFPDNALFKGDQLAGLIDFYHACPAPYLYDLSVTLNAWCFDESDARFCLDKARQLLRHYQQQRTLNSLEQAELLPMMRLAALRFWLSRLRDLHFPSSGEVVTQKDPLGKQRLLAWLMATTELVL